MGVVAWRGPKTWGGRIGPFNSAFLSFTSYILQNSLPVRYPRLGPFAIMSVREGPVMGDLVEGNAVSQEYWYLSASYSDASATVSCPRGPGSLS